MSKLTRWVLAHLHRVFLGCVVILIVGIPIDGSDWAAEARAATDTPISVRDVQQRLAELKFLPTVRGRRQAWTRGPRMRSRRSNNGMA